MAVSVCVGKKETVGVGRVWLSVGTLAEPAERGVVQAGQGDARNVVSHRRAVGGDFHEQLGVVSERPERPER